MSEGKQRIVIKDQPCVKPGCASSDAVQVYEDGSAFCFSCRKAYGDYEKEVTQKHGGEASRVGGFVPAKTPSPRNLTPWRGRVSVQEILGFKTSGFRDRGVPTDVCEFYRTRVSFDEDGAIDAHYYSYDDDTRFKERKLPKTFEWVGGACKELYGQSLFKAGGKRLIICEGEMDTLRVAYASYARYNKFYPVVGLPSASSVKLILENRSWVRSFQEVVLILDNDDAGAKATTEAVKFIGYDKVKVCRFPEKDADEIIKARGLEAAMAVIFEAHPFVPSGIISKEAIWDALAAYNQVPSTPYPPCLEGINSKLKGMRGGEITLFISGTGSGKSTMFREIKLHILEITTEMIGVISLEESPAETARKLSGMAIYKNPAKEEIPLDELRVGFDKVFGDDRLILLDHQGSMNDDSVIEKIEYMILRGCKKILIDHITILVSEGIDNLVGNEAQDKIMNELLRLVKRYPDVWIGLISHLRKTPNNAKSFEEGKLPSLDDIRGSGSVKQISFDIVAFARNLTAATDLERNTIKIRILKARFTGLTGNVAGAIYNFDTGRLAASTVDPDEEDDGEGFQKRPAPQKALPYNPPARPTSNQLLPPDMLI